MSAKWGTKQIPVTLLRGLLCWHSGHEQWQGRQGTAWSHLDTEPFPELKSSTSSSSQPGWKHVESCSSFAPQDQNFAGLISSSAADTSLPARFHWQLQLPQAAHAPQSPAGSEKQNLERKLGQRWVLPQYRQIPHIISIWLQTDLEGVKHFAFLNSSREESSSANVYRNGEKEQSKPLDFLTSGSGSDSLMNCPRSLTLPNVIFLRRGVKNHVGDQKNFGIMESCIWLYTWLFWNQRGTITKRKRKTN